ncbi:RHS repeat-associated core domain-containing protein [Burkholderia sp. BCC1640]|uniref:RHS repeat-associated core domain-containing protein n=1 Tax=Burkholderia sp. BCC1640 TaxID=2676294 RepID=UPI00158C50F1|nr:RHS repeat-associated core domain-containing protein [Burkholderia sp. BCC1640]
MALPAVKHLDPVVGVDVHSVLVTPGTPPVFLPHPHVGFMLDLREYVQAAKAVVGCIAMMIVQDKVTEYIEDHPEDVEKLAHLADEANQQVNDLMGGGKLPDFKDDPNVAEGMRLAKEANKIKNRISDDLGSNVGSGGSSGRPIFVNGMMRATAGTHAYHVPGLHFPLGESFAPPDKVEPSNDGESFMGSKTVLANNDPMSYMALEALSCWSVGMEPPPHNSAHTDRTYPSMPSSVMLPIPAGRPVLVGGPPIMNMAAAAKGLFKAFRGSKWAKTLADKLKLKSGFLRCNVLKAEPVDVTTGEVVVQQRDFTVAGRLPLVWDRHYTSHNVHDGAVGVGWQTPADIRLELTRHDGKTGTVAYFQDHTTAFDTLPTSEGWSARVYDWQYGYALYRQDSQLVLRTRESVEYRFSFSRQWVQMIAALQDNARLTLYVERISDLNENAWLFERDEHGFVTHIVEWTCGGATQRVIKCDLRDFAHADASSQGNVNLVIGLTLLDGESQAHPLVTYEHDDERNLRASVDAMAQPHRFDYENNHRMVSHTSARGVSFYYHHSVGSDGVWRVDHAWGNGGLLDYHFGYDRERMETRIVDSRGHTSVIQLNERVMPVAEINPLGGVTGFRYDAQGRTTAKIDPAGHTTAWAYDQYGNLITQTLPDNSTIRTECNADHWPVCVTLPGGRQWRYEWDGHGNLLTRITPSGATSRYAYDIYGQPVAYKGPRGALTLLEYDQHGNLAALTDALGHRTQYQYDARGNVVEAVDALGRTSRYECDRNGNLIRAIELGGCDVHCMYDPDGNLIQYRDAMGHVTQMAYSALGQVTRRIAPDGTSIEYQYNTEEQLIGVVNERDELYSLDRDALGRIIGETDYWGQTRRYRYGATDELLDSIDPLGRTIQYQYDRLGRLTERRTPIAAHAAAEHIDRFEYDRHGDLVLAENPSCRVEFRYNVDGRVIVERQGNDFTIENDYDAAGNRTERRTRLIVGSGVVEHTVRYQYDVLDAATSIKIDDAMPIMLERNTIGQVCVEQLNADLRRELSYESSGQLASQQTVLANTGVLFASEYAYDANGELIEKRDSHLGTERFLYDPMGRVTARIDPTGQLRRFLRDPAGDLLKTRIRERRPIGAVDVLQSNTWVREGEYDGCYYSYDRAGNLTRRQESRQDLTLSWDAFGQLVETVAVRRTAMSTGSDQSHIYAQYEYDPFQRRVRKIVYAGTTAAGAPSRITRFFWDGNTLLGEHSSAEGEKAIADLEIDQCGGSRATIDHLCEWIYYPETFEPLGVVHSQVAPSGMSANITEQPIYFTSTMYFHQNDRNGAPLRMHDASGNVVWECNSTEKIAYPNSKFVGQPIRLQGQYHDEEIGLHYNRYRYFDPQVDCFISQDPIGLYSGINPYQFSPNIMGWIDPLGLTADKLARNLAAAGRVVAAGQTPHHIVEENSGKSKYSRLNREILDRNGVDIDAAENGARLWGTAATQVSVPSHPAYNSGTPNRSLARATGAYHGGDHLHGPKQQKFLHRILSNAEKKGLDISAILEGIGRRMEAGSWRDTFKGCGG